MIWEDLREIILPTVYEVQGKHVAAESLGL